jgi:hypothetical protein
MTTNQLKRMSCGNPGALRVLAEVSIIQGQGPDPQRALDKLDLAGFHGPLLWALYKDHCDENPHLVFETAMLFTHEGLLSIRASLEERS